MKKLLTTTFILLFCFLLISTHNSYAFEPTNNQVVSANKVWNIQFNKELKFDDALKNSITIVDSAGKSSAITTQLGLDKKSILINPPVKGYTLGESYTLKMDKEIYSTDNTQLQNILQMTFKVNNNILIENNENVKSIFNDNCNNLITSGWSKGDNYTNDSFIADSSESGKYNTHIPYGQYLFYNTTQNSISKISKDVKIGAGPFNVEFDAKITDLQTPATNVGWRGFALDIIANNKRYHISINSKDSDNKVKINLLSKNSGTDLFKTINTYLPKDNDIHRWSIVNDGNKTISVLLDGKTIGSFANPELDAAGLTDRVIFYNDMTDTLSSYNNVYIDNFAVVNSLAIKNSTVIPDEKNQAINISTTMAIDAENLISIKQYSIKSYLYKNDKIIAETSTPLNKKTILSTLNNITQSGEMKLVLKLVTGNQVIEETTKTISMNISTANLEPGQVVNSSPGSVYLYNQMDKMSATGKNDAVHSGWNLGSYVDSESNKSGSIIENSENPLTIKMPVTLNGWFRVYVGYVTGTDSFRIGATNDSSKTQINGDISLKSNNLYGEQWINEKSTIISKFDNNSIEINPIPNKNVRIAYIKLIGLTADQVTLYQKENENKKTVIYDFDGYSDFFDGRYPTVEALKNKAVDRFSGRNVGTINWSLGGTGALNYNSKYAGNAYDGTDEFDSEFRDGDRLAKSQILNILSSGKSPLEIIADRGADKDIKVNASLRMNSFYNPTVYGFKNGDMYNKYKQFAQPGSFYLSYYHTEVRDYMKNILLESGSFNNVNGVTLDFCRYPEVFGSETPNDQKVLIMNEFLRTLRKELPKNKTITIRVPWKNPIQYGFDVNAWVKEGLLDTLVPSSIGNEDNKSFEISSYVNMVKNTNVKLYIGITADVSGHDITKEEEQLVKQGLYIHNKEYLDIEQYLLRAYDVYEDGADGLFLFNSTANLYLDSRAPVESSYLGDKIQIQKWHQFDYVSGFMTHKINVSKPSN
ncbi:glycoside hydrolase family 10 protein [Clostridium estertheticum]|uniref:hypothetical protein n=1 Tax=Clostridium estertheticum TaxID=238834 RepID=UPI0009FFD32F|nr:hypothetical protein [Clostridium estertheticum]MBZ9617145.1 hypothetical protein [Clostridium estertheticum subsp. laramiense]WAG72837.1 hypothetical protein LL032_17025 [Clostridium estertheticum]